MPCDWASAHAPWQGGILKRQRTGQMFLSPWEMKRLWQKSIRITMSPQRCGIMISKRRGLAWCTWDFRNMCIWSGIFRGLWQLGMRVTRQQTWFGSWCGTNVWTSLNHWLAKEAIRLLKQLPLLLIILSLLWIQAPRNLYQRNRILSFCVLYIYPIPVTGSE